MAGIVQDSGTFPGIARTLLSLALLAERAAVRSFPVRFIVLAILYRAEAIARRFVVRETATLVAEAIEAGCPCPDCPDLACLDEPAGLHYGAADAVLLSLRLRMLAAILGALADANGDFDDRVACPADGSANRASRTGGADLPLLLVWLPATRGLVRPHDTS